MNLARTLLAVASVLELLTGVALIAAPQAASMLLLGGELSSAGIGVCRITGAALLALGVGCWPRRDAASDLRQKIAAMLTYGGLVTLYLGRLGVGGHFGVLLWPAVALHALLSLLLAYSLWATRRTPGLAPGS